MICLPAAMRCTLFVLFASISLILAPRTVAHPTYATRVAHYSHCQLAYQRQVVQLDQLVRLQKAEIESLHRRLQEWEPMDQFRTGRALMMDVEITQLALIRAEMNLEKLQQEQFDLTRSRGRGW